MCKEREESKSLKDATRRAKPEALKITWDEGGLGRRGRLCDRASLSVFLRQSLRRRPARRSLNPMSLPKVRILPVAPGGPCLSDVRTPPRLAAHHQGVPILLPSSCAHMLNTRCVTIVCSACFRRPSGSLRIPHRASPRSRMKTTSGTLTLRSRARKAARSRVRAHVKHGHRGS